MTDHDRLREAIHQMRLWMPRHPAAVWAQAVHDAAVSTLSRMPRKHVAYAAVGPHSAGSVYWSKEEAQAEAVCDWVVIELVGYGPEAPTTKMVKVWRVEYSWQSRDCWTASISNHPTEGDARIHAQAMEMDSARACIRVTGPYQQEVPV